MKAVILVGGEGTRLRPLTCNTPKAIVPILNRPFLEHLLGYLKEHGVTDAILAMAYLPDPIQSCLGDGTQLGVQLTYLVEESPLGTAGAVKNAESYLDGPFLVFNGDIITDIDLTAMMKRHKEVKPKVSIALTPVDNPTIYGVVETDTRGIVQRFVEKPSWDKVTTNMINAGIYILEPEVLAHIPASTPSMFENYLFPRLLEMGEPILGYPSDAYWIDIGTPEKYLKVNHDLLLQQAGRGVQAKGKSQLHPTAQIEGPVLIAEGCIIAEDAKLKGPVVLGPHCEIGKGAVVQGAILWHHSRVGEKAILKNCVVCSHSYVGQGSHVPDNCVLGDSVTVASENILDKGTKVWPDGYAESNATQP
ncbi:MAG: NDP-sugar synthase [Chloroflexota bacterium]|nr:NDP-sugar synthase [Chloroflexota bacterium]